ncbi:glycerol-3-phosphate acyltransferase [Phycicoccus duodecadis]|uniref:Glycerol-3-phosphate acyltransferase n=1 Tax=Phycicoccus duodecadis TaxID=173053 RepID=A0A2N3YFZ6_9MICO|nr:glycerol-3-phosphate acyltransferase [Phycicoccus duodecadis]PKW25768.1 acyl-phosphate glycerol-3-phosphate acyltransferase [Phycicoccus duodecadis]
MGALLLVLWTAALVVAAFLVGSVNPATLVARALGRDLRTAGSGNPGATNAGRVLGPRWGVLVLVLDVLKAYLPTLLVARAFGVGPALLVGLAVVLGHTFSPFLRGRGGKGVACALGAILAVEPLVAVGALVLFAVAVAVLRVVGEASVVATVGLLLVGVLGVVGLLPFVSAWVGGWLVLVAAVVLSRHHRNVRAWWWRRRRR